MLERIEATSMMASAVALRSSLSPPEVPMELHIINRQKLLKAIRQRLSESRRPIQGLVLLQGGEEKLRYCTDHEELFRQESYFAYLFGVKEPGFFGAIDVATGNSLLFAPRLPAEYAVWLGEIKPLSYFKERYMATMVYFSDDMVQVLQDQYPGQSKPLLFLLHGLNTDSSNFSKPAEFKGIEKFESDLSTLHPILTECRVTKSELELEIIQFANDISSEAHVEVMRCTKVGMKEYQLESVFLHHSYMYGGCRHCSYTCICATGTNSSVLHYGHAAAPNDKILQNGDMALFDMGAEYNFYGSDITCSFPVNGTFSEDQHLIYTQAKLPAKRPDQLELVMEWSSVQQAGDAVLAAHDDVIAAMKPGINWVDMHRLAEKVILESLKKGNLLFGNLEDMMAQRLGAVFMPHGLGHLLGIDTHDPGGYMEGIERPKEPGLRSLRTARDLKENMVITVEPGCYFINALLAPAMESPATSRFFNRDAIKRFEGFGGVRIESNLYITADGCVNMTNVPRETWEIEAVMAGCPWPLDKLSVGASNGN
ncbi:hypothetical protein V2J09_012326 [Rumex salicifolius]